MKFNSKSLLAGSLFLAAFILSGCGRAPETVSLPPAAAVPVKVQSASSSQVLVRQLSYPGLIAAENEAKIIAKIGGTVKEFKLKAGDPVRLGDELVRIDDVNGPSSGSGWSASQIKQARIAVDQAQASYQLAKSNYDNLLEATTKDLRQAEIARDQAAASQSNLNITASESDKSVRLAYETAKLATEQARLNLENRKKQAEQGSGDAVTNASTAADTAIASAGAIITGLNNIASFADEQNVSIAYRNNLGALDAAAYPAAKEAYAKASGSYKLVSTAVFSSITDKLASAADLADKVKGLADAAKILLDKSISSSVLPASSLSGPSLSGLQASVSAYQGQANGLLSQVNGAKQLLANTDLNNSTSLDGLQKAYELAKQQEASAAQNVANLQAGNQAQKDQAGLAVAFAANQYENTRIKLDTQLQAAKTQLQTAQLQADNAVTALQNLYDNHLLVAPIAGRLSNKLVSEGETVSPGQVLASISQTSSLKAKFYVDADNLGHLHPGQEVAIMENDSHQGTAIITSVSLQPDSLTKRFLVEAALKPEGSDWTLGTVVDVLINIKDLVTAPNQYFLPLAAIEIGQSSSSVFIIANGQAERRGVAVVKVEGESAVVEASFSGSDQIIIDGNKLLSDGQAVAASGN